MITFVTENNNLPDPVSTTAPKFRDIIFAPNLRGLNLKMDVGPNWIRFLPPIQGTAYDWMLALEIVQAPYGQSERMTAFVHPRTFRRGETSPFDTAYNWYKANAKQELYARTTNPHGVRLQPVKQGIAWAIHTGKEEGERLSIFLHSLYNGEWGGNIGLAYRLWTEANRRDNEPNSPTFQQPLYGNITQETAGKLVCIEKNKGEGKEAYASYNVRIGKTDAPIATYLELLTDAEKELLCPLEKTVYIPTEQEQNQILADYIGEKRFNEIFGKVSLGDPRVFTAPQPAAPPPAPAPAPAPAIPAQQPPATPAAELPTVATPNTQAEPLSLSTITKNIATKEGILWLFQPDNWARVQEKHRVVVREVASQIGLTAP